MEIILTNKSFDTDNIIIKFSKTNQKIIYTINNISIIGIPLKLSKYEIIYDNNKNLIIKIKDEDDIKIFENINRYFVEKYKNKFRNFIKDNILKIRKNDLKLITNDETIYISINNIKKKGEFYTLHTFII
jgi:hypothetical protein